MLRYRKFLTVDLAMIFRPISLPYRNKVTHLPKMCRTLIMVIAIRQYFRFSVGLMYGYVADGIFKTTRSQSHALQDGAPGAYPLQGFERRWKLPAK